MEKETKTRKRRQVVLLKTPEWEATQRHPWVELDEDMALDVDHFERLGRLEYLIRSVSKDYEFWNMGNVQTGEGYPGYFTPTQADLALVLDGDHILSYNWEIISVEHPSGNVVEEVKEMKELFPDAREDSGIGVVTFPTPEKFVYTHIRARSVFDPHYKVERFVMYKVGAKEISVWKWDLNKVEKEYTITFKTWIRDMIALPKVSRIGNGDEIAISFLKSVVIFDLSSRTRLRKFKSPGPGSAPIPLKALILPDGHLGLQWSEMLSRDPTKGWRHVILDVFYRLRKGEEKYSEIQITSIQEGGEGDYEFGGDTFPLIFFDFEGQKETRSMLPETTYSEFLLLTSKDGKPFRLIREHYGEGEGDVGLNGEVIKSPKQDITSIMNRNPDRNGVCMCVFHGSDLGIVQGSEFSFSEQELYMMKNPSAIRAGPDYDLTIGKVTKSYSRNPPKGWSKPELLAEVVRQGIMDEKKAKKLSKESLGYELKKRQEVEEKVEEEEDEETRG